MNAIQKAVSAYGDNSTALKTSRNIEYDVFARVTRQLQIYADRSRAEFPKFAMALHKNRQLWVTLAADVSSDMNMLPRDIKAKIFYLSEFTDQETRKVLTGKASVAGLIEVNKAIMRGLSQAGDT